MFHDATTATASRGDRNLPAPSEPCGTTEVCVVRRGPSIAARDWTNSCPGLLPLSVQFLVSLSQLSMYITVFTLSGLKSFLEVGKLKIINRQAVAEQMLGPCSMFWNSDWRECWVCPLPLSPWCSQQRPFSLFSPGCCFAALVIFHRGLDYTLVYS